MKTIAKLMAFSILIFSHTLNAQPNNNDLFSYKELKNANNKLLLARDSIAFLAMSRIFDLNYSEEDRISMVVLLGEIGTDTCIRFLMKNLDKNIYTGIISGDGDLAKAMIFRSALLEIQDWKIVSYIVKKLDEQINEKEFLTLAAMLERLCGKKVARSILVNQYRGLLEPRRANLNKLLTFFPEK